MPLSILVLVLFSVASSSLAQILLKHGMSSSAVQSVMRNLSASNILVVATNPYVLGGLGLYGLGALVWLGVLARVDVSLAYPFVSLGFILTMILAILMLGEPLSMLRVAGTCLIAVGAVLVARSA